MHEWQRQSHVRWECKYHVVIVPKYRKKLLYGNLRHQVGLILKELCRQKGVEVIEGHVMPDHVHMCLSIPPRLQSGVRGRVPEGQERVVEQPLRVVQRVVEGLAAERDQPVAEVGEI